MTMLLPTWLAWQAFQLIPAPHSPIAVVLVIAVAFSAVAVLAVAVKGLAYLDSKRNAHTASHRGGGEFVTLTERWRTVWFNAAALLWLFGRDVRKVVRRG